MCRLQWKNGIKPPFPIIRYRNAGARAHNMRVRVRKWFCMAADREGDKKIPDTFHPFVG